MILFFPSSLLSPYFRTSQLSQHVAKLCRHFTTVPVLRDSFLSQRLPLLFNNGLPFSQMPEMPISTIFQSLQILCIHIVFSQIQSQCLRHGFVHTSLNRLVVKRPSCTESYLWSFATSGIDATIDIHIQHIFFLVSSLHLSWFQRRGLFRPRYRRFRDQFGPLL